ncbi:VPS13 domain-containing protein [Phanerochaete sordida]|uniref:VPS13 domain-containing protein n=1 Tax=Phanerochaete sordida TaxID=48140 RepID=A0A9P3FXS1_9APHY|nr:VPS13 domain-containing protein [Phanerochaete sordida]
MPNETDVESSIARAQTSLQVAPTAADAEKSSRRASIIGAISVVQTELASPTVQALAPVASQAAQLVQSQFSTLTSTCKVLSNALDDLTKIHPFVAVAVLAFKTALQFEMTRRQNDKRIMLLQLKMNDTLSVLLILRKIDKTKRADDGKTIEERLGARIKAIAADIEKYSAICDTFSKKKKVVKLFRSLEWENKLEGFAKVFEDHKEALHDDLAIFASVGIQQANETLGMVSLQVESVRDKTSTLLLLQALRSPVDRELIREIELNGGADNVLKDENLMRRLVGKSGDKDAQGDGKMLSKDAQAVLLKDIVRDVNKSFSEMLQENEELFSRKFKAQQEVLVEEMSNVVRREGDRVINTITSGPHDRIIDKDLYFVWKESGWKGTTKARSLVLGLREYYAERHKANSLREQQALKQIASSEPDSTTLQDVAQAANSGVLPGEDEWALEYITISRIQPLLEAFDDDASSLVSVSEVNAFSSARPKDWSLAKWMAYWAAGFPLTLNYYFRRIQVMLARIGYVVYEVHNMRPGNNVIVSKLMNDVWPTHCLDRILAGVHAGPDLAGWNEDFFDRFKGYVESEEARLKKRLVSLKYFIDAPNTLQFVIGSSRLEKSLFPLIYLLLQRAWHVFRRARTVDIHPQEITNIVSSIGTIYIAACARADHITAMCKLQNLDPKEQLRKFSHGIYYFSKYGEESDILNTSEYLSAIYLRSKDDHYFYSYSGIPLLNRFLTVCVVYYTDIDTVKEDQPPEELLYPEMDLDPHVEVYDEGEVQHSLISVGLSSAWSGHFSVKQFDGSFTGQASAGVFYLTLPPAGEDGLVTGSGIDGAEDFTVKGKLQGEDITLIAAYPATKYWLAGTLSSARDALELTFAAVDSPDAEDLDAAPKDDAIAGRMKLRLAPVRFSYLVPSAEALAENKPRAFWKFAIESVLNVVRARAGHFAWPYLQDRRRVRQRFIELHNRLKNDALPGLPPAAPPLTEGESEEFASLVTLCSKQDLQLYRRLALIMRRKEKAHCDLSCDACGGIIYSPRYVCLDCLSIDPETGKCADKGLGNMIDICPGCIAKPAHRAADNKNHVPSHALYQLRQASTKREEWEAFLSYRLILDELRRTEAKKEVHSQACHYCHDALAEAESYWYCIGCEGATWICMKCKAEKEDTFVRSENLSYAKYMSVIQANRADASQDSTAAEESGASGPSEQASDPAAPPDVVVDGPPAPSAAEVEPTPTSSDSAAAGSQDEESAAAAAQEGFVVDDAQEPADSTPTTAAEQTQDEAKPEAGQHEIGHHLILYHPAAKTPAEETRSEESVNSTLLKMQDRLSSFDSRLERLEGLLDRLVGALGTGLKAAESVAA